MVINTIDIHTYVHICVLYLINLCYVKFIPILSVLLLIKLIISIITVERSRRMENTVLVN